MYFQLKFTGLSQMMLMILIKNITRLIMFLYLFSWYHWKLIHFQLVTLERLIRYVLCFGFTTCKDLCSAAGQVSCWHCCRCNVMARFEDREAFCVLDYHINQSVIRCNTTLDFYYTTNHIDYSCLKHEN